VQLIHKVAPVVVLVVLDVGLDEPLVEIADIGGEDREPCAEEMVADIEDANDDRELVPVQLGITPEERGGSSGAYLLDNPYASELY
jgi:hypothetical protein